MMSMAGVCAASRQRALPALLFQAGEVGAWYDPSDLSTMFRFSGGFTYPASVGQAVSLVLDKSLGLALGPELASNGRFDSSLTGWNVGANTSASVVSGEAQVTFAGAISSTSDNWFALAGSYAFGKVYDVSFDATYVSGTGSLQVGAGYSSSLNITPASNGGVKTRYSARVAGAFTSAAGIAAFAATAGATVWKIDNVSVREVTGTHAYQDTVASMPTLQQDSGGRYYVSFDGVDDRLKIKTANAGDWAFNSRTVVIGFRHTAAIEPGVFAFLGRSISNWYIGLNTGRLFTSHANAAATQKTVSHGAAVSANTSYVATYGWAVAGSDVTVSGRLNGVAQTPVPAQPFTDGLSSVGGADWVLGSFATAGAPLPAHRLYGLIIRGATTSGARLTAVERWMAQKTGVTL